MLYITHELVTAYYVSDKIAIMFRGNIVGRGLVKQVLMSPSHSYAQLLSKSIPEADPKKRWYYTINFLETKQAGYLRKGCKFAGRCAKVIEKCKTEIPQIFRWVRFWSSFPCIPNTVQP